MIYIRVFQIKEHKCDCGKEFVHMKNLREHRAVVHGEGTQLKCSICKATVAPSNMAQHKEKHLDTPVNICPKCGRSIKQKRNLGRHIRGCKK